MLTDFTDSFSDKFRIECLDDFYFNRFFTVLQLLVIDRTRFNIIEPLLEHFVSLDPFLIRSESGILLMK
jgi:hypothetical protein